MKFFIKVWSVGGGMKKQELDKILREFQKLQEKLMKTKLASACKGLHTAQKNLEKATKARNSNLAKLTEDLKTAKSALNNESKPWQSDIKKLNGYYTQLQGLQKQILSEKSLLEEDKKLSNELGQQNITKIKTALDSFAQQPISVLVATPQPQANQNKKPDPGITYSTADYLSKQPRRAHHDISDSSDEESSDSEDEYDFSSSSQYESESDSFFAANSGQKSSVKLNKKAPKQSVQKRIKPTHENKALYKN